MFEDLCITIVNRDLKIDTSECIDSLIKAGADLSQIVVVDNGSKDGSVQFLQERYGTSLNQIEATENFGYPYGLNLGIQFFLPKSYQWFLLMNNDTIVAPDFLQAIHRATQKGDSYALFGPMILYFGQPKKIWFMGAHLIPGTLLYTNDDRGKEDGTVCGELIPVDFVHGCTMIVKRSVFEKIGFFDDTSPIYGDDVDFSWRAQQAGFKLAAIPEAKLWHKVSAFMQRHKPKTRYLRTRNQIWFYRRYSRGAQLLLMIVFTLFRSLWIGLKDLFSWHLELIPPLVFGWIDGWRGSGDRKFS